MKKAKRRLFEVDVEFISLVDRSGNLKTILWKSATISPDQNKKVAIEKSINIIQTDGDKRIASCIVYYPNEVDSESDTASAKVIEQMA